MKTYQCCPAPFFYIELHEGGEVFTCCPAYIKYSIGNIYQNSIEEIWNSPKAQNLRDNILKNNYSSCRTDVCGMYESPQVFELDYVNTETPLNRIMPLPNFVKFCHDRDCIIQCITCRKQVERTTKQNNLSLNEHIETAFFPLLQNAEIVCMNGSGEALSSPHGKTLLKKISTNFPHIRFILHTNGLLCSYPLLKKLGILHKLKVVEVSIHAVTKTTYDKICIGSNFDRVMQNVKMLAELKAKGILDDLYLFFVVSKLNFHEMEPFAHFASELGAKAFYWEYRNWGAQTKKEAQELSVIDSPDKKTIQQIQRTLRQPIFSSSSCMLSPQLKMAHAQTT